MTQITEIKKKPVTSTKSQYKGFQIEESIPDEIQYEKKTKFLWEIFREVKDDLNQHYFFKIYAQLHSKKKYLLKSGILKSKNHLKIKLKTKLSGIIPVRENIRFRFCLYARNKPLLNHISKAKNLITHDLKKNISFIRCHIKNQYLQSRNPLNFYLVYHLGPLKKAQKLEFQLSVNISENNTISKKNTFQISNFSTTWKKNRLEILQIPMPVIQERNKKYAYQIIIIDPLTSQILYKTTGSVPSNPELHGLFCEDIKYNEKLTTNQVSYMIGKIINNTNYKVKGKSLFEFQFANQFFKEGFRRKVRIDPSNYELLSEDIMLPVYAGGYHYRVLGTFFLKTSQGKIWLEHQTNKRLLKIPDPYFIIDLRALIRNPPVKPNDIIPVYINYRLRDEQFKPKKTICIISLNYENIEEKDLFSFTIKKDFIAHTHFDWKVPKIYGTIELQVKLLCDGIPIHQDNIQYQPLSFDIFPLAEKRNEHDGTRKQAKKQ